MNTASLARLLNLLSIASANPAFSGAGIAISSVLKLAASIVEIGGEGGEKLKALTAEVESMVAEGRQPSAGEWKSLRKRSDDAHAILQAHATPQEAPVEAPTTDVPSVPHNDGGMTMGNAAIAPAEELPTRPEE